MFIKKIVALNLVVIFPRGKKPPYSPYFGIERDEYQLIRGLNEPDIIRRS